LGHCLGQGSSKETIFNGLDPDQYQTTDNFKQLFGDLNLNNAPYPESGPITIYAGIEIEEIRRIDATKRQYYIRGYFWAYWKDSRAKFVAPKNIESIKFNAKGLFSEGFCWDPQFEFVNADTPPRRSLETVEIFPEGEVEYWTLFTGVFSDRSNLMDFHSFPFDSQNLTIDVVTAYPKNKILFAPCKETTQEDYTKIINKLSHPEWTFEKQSMEIHKILYTSEFDREFSVLRAIVNAKRKPGYYMLQIVLPVSAIMIVFYFSLWIEPKHIEAQLGTAITCLLSLIAFTIVVSSETPKIGYPTVLGWFLTIAYITFVCGIGAIIKNHVSEQKNCKVKVLEKTRRIIGYTFLIAIICITLMFLF
jgi:hypothetical protein